jgi:hypothetical protein
MTVAIKKRITTKIPTIQASRGAHSDEIATPLSAWVQKGKIAMATLHDESRREEISHPSSK